VVLVWGRDIERLAPDVYLVPSCSGEGNYRVAHELMDDEERQELRDRVLALRRRLYC
jgi:hypothetical protein